ncbi:MAG: RelA/SpoT family protein [Polyangiales bacterium]
MGFPRLAALRQDLARTPSGAPSSRAAAACPSADDLVAAIRGYFPHVQGGLVRRAYAFAENAHQGQWRKSGDPYFVHPAKVAAIIAQMRLDPASVAAALLHDVVEDTDITCAELSAAFGEEIAFLVDAVTKLGRVNFSCKEDQQAESFRKMLVAMASDIRVLLVKLADRLDNMRTLNHMKVEAQERIATETRDIYAPLAGRLGIHWLKAELEDWSFRYLQPESHLRIDREVRRLAKDNDRYIQEVCTLLARMFSEHGFFVEVSGRVKHHYSIHAKMRRTGCDFDQVNDFIAFRVLVPSVADCYALLGVVHSEWTPIPGRFRDYIALPKPNMYQSLHTTLIGPEHRRIEVQIRTHEMHSTAELGIAAHWQYKEGGGGIAHRDARRFAWLRQLLEFQREVSDPAEFFEGVKVDLFPDEVYVFTPRGDVKTLPRGASILDFAYSIHSEVGDHCRGARVNGAIAPLKTKVHNGDVVEIITSPQQRPSKDWLEHVVTSRARSKIRLFIRGEERKHSISMGRGLLERELRRRDLSVGRALRGDNKARLLSALKLQNLEEVYSQLGYGHLAASTVAELLTPEDDPQTRESLRPSIFERTVDKVTRREASGGICIDGIDNVLVRFARCCNPVPGEPVSGWITRGRGVTVHRRGCIRALELDPQRRVEVSWSGPSQTDLPVTLRVITSDRPGLLATISAAFTKAGINIREANCRTQDDGRALSLFHIGVSDVQKLRSLMRNLAKIPGVEDVSRG